VLGPKKTRGEFDAGGRNNLLLPNIYANKTREEELK
jgi:hypothetical protein